MNQSAGSQSTGNNVNIGVAISNDATSNSNNTNNSAMLIPRGPRAWPMAGPGRAVPEGTRSLTCRRKDMRRTSGDDTI